MGFLAQGGPSGILTVDAASRIVEWSATGVSDAQVYVTCSYGERKLFADGLSGRAPAPWLGQAAPCTFELVEVMPPEQEGPPMTLATSQVDAQGAVSGTAIAGGTIPAGTEPGGIAGGQLWKQVTDWFSGTTFGLPNYAWGGLGGLALVGLVMKRGRRR